VFAKIKDCAQLYPRSVWLIAAASVVLGLIYAVWIQIGLPGDEPAHFKNVVFYQEHLTMPVLGAPGVDYEGQMGPVYYALAGIVYGLFKPLGVKAAYFAVRLSGIPLIPLAVLVSYRVARLARPDSDHFAIATACFMGLNPSLLSIGASVQNDYLSILIATFAMLICYHGLQDDSRLPAKGALIGLLVSLGILTKATVVFLVAAIPIYAFLRFRFKSWTFAATFLSVVFVLTAWFFIRNYLLYGDFSAQAALTKFHYSNNPPPTDLTKFKNLIHWLWVMESYYWLPIQYYRDTFHVPMWLRAVIGGLTASGLIGAVVWFRDLKNSKANQAATIAFVLFLLTQYAASLSLYTYTCMRLTHFAPRVTFPSIIAYALIIAAGMFIWQKVVRKPAEIYNWCLLMALLAGNGYVLWRASFVPNYHFIRFDSWWIHM
jgi:hypothetical protein